MEKKSYIGLVIFLLVILILGGIYWQSKNTDLPSTEIESEITIEEESFSQDIADLKELAQDASFEDLTQELTDIEEAELEEIPPEENKEEAAVSKTTTTNEEVDLASIENLENELALELDSFSSDLNDLEGISNDSSFDALDSGLSGVAE